jgi:hypothetical protein
MKVYRTNFTTGCKGQESGFDLGPDRFFSNLKKVWQHIAEEVAKKPLSTDPNTFLDFVKMPTYHTFRRWYITGPGRNGGSMSVGFAFADGTWLEAAVYAARNVV